MPRKPGKHPLLPLLFFLALPIWFLGSGVPMLLSGQGELRLNGAVFLFAGLALLIGTPVALRRSAAASIPFARCTRCGHDLSNLPVTVRECPECGLDIRGIVRSCR